MKKVLIKKGTTINLNNEVVTVTDVIKNLGFYYENVGHEIKFCNIMFEALNFEPVYE